MRILRTLSTARLVVLAAVAVAVAFSAAAIAVAARGGGGPTPPPKPLAQALHDAAAAAEPDGVTARIRFTNRLFPSGSLIGSVGSALMSGASGRVWATNDGRGRLELQSDAGDVQIVWTTTHVSIYDASSNTVYKAALPAHDATPDKTGTPPSLSEIESFLAKLGAHASISGAEPTNVAGRPAYKVSVAPKHDGGLLGSVALAWDALRGVPLRVAVYAQGASAPVLELAVTDISFGAVPAADVDVTPPASAKVVDLGAVAKPKRAAGDHSSVSGLDAVRAAAPFPVVAPDTLVGLPLKDVRLVGPTDSPTALAIYGQGLGAIVVIERAPDASAAGKGGGVLASLPTVALDGATAHELATQLGTVLEWQRAGTAFVLAGSLPPAAAESAARALR
jgi:outer membrane lipoprotein-sorting protein